MNVIRTMVLVSVTYALCFVCMRTYSILRSLEVARSSGSLFLLFSMFMYTNRVLNPFIYATQYEIVTRWWKVVVIRVVRRQNVQEEAPDVTSQETARKPSTSHFTVQHM